jgi:hypothetical protein
MNYIDVNTRQLKRGEYYLFEFGDADYLDIADITDITEGNFNETPSEYTSRYLGKFLVKYNNINEEYPTFIFYDVLPVNDKIPILEEIDNRYLNKDRVLIYNYRYSNSNGQIPIKVYVPSETIIDNIKQKYERKMSKTLKEQRKVNKTTKRMTKKVKADELRRHISSFIRPPTP